MPINYWGQSSITQQYYVPSSNPNLFNDSMPNRHRVLHNMKSNFAGSRKPNNYAAASFSPVESNFSPIENYPVSYHNRGDLGVIAKEHKVIQLSRDMPSIPDEEGISLGNKIILKRNIDIKNKINLQNNIMSKIIKDHNIKITNSEYDGSYFRESIVIWRGGDSVIK